MLEEASGSCPNCGESITLLLDLSVDEQDYIEDCEVCCRPMRVLYAAESGQLVSLQVLHSDA